MAYGAILGQTTPLASVVASGNMNAVTSDAVYQAIAAIPEGAQIVTGSYVGTGKYGESNPNTITTGFKPKWAFIMCNNYGSSDYNDLIFFSDNAGLLVKNASGFDGGIISSYGGGLVKNTFAQDGLTWYANQAATQANVGNANYYYIIIG